MFNSKAKLNKHGYQAVFMPDIRIKYFVLDKDDKIMFFGSSESIPNMTFNNSLDFIDSIKAIKLGGKGDPLFNEMQIETKDGSFDSWGFIYPDTDIGAPHPKWIGHFIR